jgi:formylglycine-generating enzyme required for sulfatase activity
VREEIAAALRRGIVVIPVLIERAILPRNRDLPEDIAEMVLHEKHDITHRHFGRDTDTLIAAIKSGRNSSRPGKSPLVIAAAGALFVIVGGAVVWQGDLLPRVPSVSLNSKQLPAITVPTRCDDGLIAQVGPERRCLRPKDTFKGCPDCPEMVVVPSGAFTMGTPSTEEGHLNDEGPQHKVTIRHPFAIGEGAVTLGEFAAFIADTRHNMDGGCNVATSGHWETQLDKSWRAPGFQQNDSHPVVCVSWEDAKAYTSWLSHKTGKPYRLPSEAEREYAARAGTATKYWWGNDIGKENANCSTCGSQWDDKQTAQVGSFQPNTFGLYDMNGNVWEWVEDIYHQNYAEAPTDGSAWQGGNASIRIFRGGAWHNVLNRPGFAGGSNS